jgi:hypothetical protein
MWSRHRKWWIKNRFIGSQCELSQFYFLRTNVCLHFLGNFFLSLSRCFECIWREILSERSHIHWFQCGQNYIWQLVSRGDQKIKVHCGYSLLLFYLVVSQLYVLQRFFILSLSYDCFLNPRTNVTSRWFVHYYFSLIRWVMCWIINIYFINENLNSFMIHTFPHRAYISLIRSHFLNEN